MCSYCLLICKNKIFYLLFLEILIKLCTLIFNYHMKYLFFNVKVIVIKICFNTNNLVDHLFICYFYPLSCFNFFFPLIFLQLLEESTHFFAYYNVLCLVQMLQTCLKEISLNYSELSLIC